MLVPMDRAGHQPAPTPRSFEAVLLPLDGSSRALTALPTARALCRRFSAHLVILSVAARHGLRVGATAAEIVAASTAPALVVPLGDE